MLSPPHRHVDAFAVPAIRILLGVIATIYFAIIVAAPAFGEEAGPQPSDPVGHLVDLVNRERAAAGVPPVRIDGALNSEGQSHSIRMADAGDIFHNEELFTPAAKDRLNAKTLGENVASNTSLDDAHRRLMASEGHRANILQGAFDRVGIGVQRSGETWYLTQVFAESRPAAPAPAPAPNPESAVDPSPAADPAPAAAPAAAITTTSAEVAPTSAAPAPAPASHAATTARPASGQVDITLEVADTGQRAQLAHAAFPVSHEFGAMVVAAVLVAMTTLSASRRFLRFS